MNLNEAIADARRRIEALDLSADNARLAEIAEQLGQIDRALSAANARREEVLILLRPFRSNSGSIPLPEGTGGSVANALLAGVAASEAAGVAVDEAQLERELAALKAGMAELQQRQSNLTTERLSLPSAVGRRIMAEIKPLCDAIESEARDAASIIEEAFAALSAITKATRTHSVALEATAAAIAGMRGGRGLLVASDTVSVPAGITEVLALLAEKGPAYTGGKPTSVRVAENEGRETAKAMAQAVADYDGPETPEMATAKVVQKKWWGRN
jgi:hypothetical protein